MSKILKTSYMDVPLNYCAVERRELVVVPSRTVGNYILFWLSESNMDWNRKPLWSRWIADEIQPLLSSPEHASKQASEEGLGPAPSFPPYVLRNLDPPAPSGPCLNDVFIVFECLIQSTKFMLPLLLDLPLRYLSSPSRCWRHLRNVPQHSFPPVLARSHREWFVDGINHRVKP